MVSSARLGQIARYVDKKGMIFPNSIVVALSPDCWSYHTPTSSELPLPNWQTCGMLTLKGAFDTCWVIDGQHRLYSYSRASTDGRLIVSAFARITEKQQAQYFLDINREAKKVDANLLWDLLGSTNQTTEDDDVSRIRKNLASRAGRTDLRNQLVRLLQETYSKEYGLGLLLEERSLAKDVNSLELALNQATDAYLTDRYGEDWFHDQSILGDASEQRRIKAKLQQRAGSKPWEHLNFLMTINSIVCRKEHWDDFFSDVFKQAGIPTSNELKLFAGRLWDYRSNKLAHERVEPVIYSRQEENLVQSLYEMMKKAIAAANAKLAVSEAQSINVLGPIESDSEPEETAAQ
jgi:DGQHR domain-containing protein